METTNRLGQYRSRRTVTPVLMREELPLHQSKIWKSKDGMETLITEMEDKHLRFVYSFLQGVIKIFNFISDDNNESMGLWNRCIKEAIVAAIAIRYIGYEMHLRNIEMPFVDLSEIQSFIKDDDYKHSGFADTRDAILLFKD